MPRCFGFALTTLLLTPLFCLAQVAAPDFTIILLPDTQNEAQYYPQVFNSQTQWIASNQANLNIQAVLGLGDIVNDGADTAQQQNADAAIKILDNVGVPYFLAIGNHDYDGANTGAAARDADGYNQWFGAARYSGKSYYQGSFPAGSNENFYGVLTINGKQYLILVLEFIPRTTALNWAASVVQANPDKEVIMVTHSFLYYDGTRADVCDTQDLTRDNDGEGMWAAFVSQYPNIIMVVSGHLTAKSAARRADLGVNGNLVNQMFSNYQTLANGGNGWLRILTFHPASNTISVQTYSPYLNAYKTDSDNQFTIDYHNPGFNTGVGRITGRVKSSGCAVIADATLSAGDTSTLTDANGNFSLSVPPGTYTLSVSASGWGAQSRSVKVDDNYASDNNFYLSASATPTTCTLNTASPSVTICTPTANAAVTSPVHIVAGATDSKPVNNLQIYVDGVKQYQVAGGSLDTSLAMTSGTRRLTVQGYDGTTIFKQTIYINVATAAPPVVISPSSLTFASQTVGSSSASQTLTVTNETANAVSFISITASGDYSQTNNCGASLAAGASCTVNVTFTPTAAGTLTGTLTLTDSAANSPQTASLSGTGASNNPQFTVSPASLTFASQNVGSSSTPQVVNVVNGTAHRVDIASIATSADFSQSNNCGPKISAGASCTVNVTFTPTATGTRSGTLTLTDSDPSSPQVVSLTGMGASASSCNLSTVNPSVTICTPAANATVTSPVHIVASATDSKPVSYMQIYVDGVKQYQVSGGSLDTSLAMAAGTRRLTVQAGDGTTIFKQTIYVTVQ